MKRALAHVAATASAIALWIGITWFVQQGWNPAEWMEGGRISGCILLMLTIFAVNLFAWGVLEASDD